MKVQPVDNKQRQADHVNLLARARLRRPFLMNQNSQLLERVERQL
jgi:hypothetical protein